MRHIHVNLSVYHSTDLTAMPNSTWIKVNFFYQCKILRDNFIHERRPLSMLELADINCFGHKISDRNLLIVVFLLILPDKLVTCTFN